MSYMYYRIKEVAEDSLQWVLLLFFFCLCAIIALNAVEMSGENKWTKMK